MTPLVSSACTQIYLHGCTKFMFAVLGGVEKIRVRDQIGKIFQGFTHIFGVFGPFFNGIW